MQVTCLEKVETLLVSYNHQNTNANFNKHDLPEKIIHRDEQVYISVPLLINSPKENLPLYFYFSCIKYFFYT